MDEIEVPKEEATFQSLGLIQKGTGRAELPLLGWMRLIEKQCHDPLISIGA